MDQLFVYGSGGHAKVVIDILELRCPDSVRFVIDDDPATWGTSILDKPVLGGRDELWRHRRDSGVTHGIVAIGDNHERCRIAERLRAEGFILISALHPSAVVSTYATVGSGSVVVANAVINAHATLGKDVILNTRASIGHDCTVGDGVHIAPGAVVCGSVTIGARTRIWAGATVINDVHIGNNVIVAAGAVVVRDVSDNLIVRGVPARAVERGQRNAGA